MTATQTVKIEFDDQVVERRWSDANEKFDWTPFLVGYGILLNERYQFPMDMALVRAKLDTKRQLFVDNHMIAHMQGVLRETHATKDHPSNPVFAPHKLYPTFIYHDPEHGYRLYYNAGCLQHVAYSKDGVNWERPELNQTTDWSDPENFAGGPNNVVGFGQICGLMHMADDPNSEKRWKMIAKPFSGNNVCPPEKYVTNLSRICSCPSMGRDAAAPPMCSIRLRTATSGDSRRRRTIGWDRISTWMRPTTGPWGAVTCFESVA